MLTSKSESWSGALFSFLGSSRRFRQILVAVAACLALSLTQDSALAQRDAPPGTFDFQSGRLPVASLDGLWRFQAGDDARYADPTLDDSSWLLVRSDLPWTEQHIPATPGVFWYRIKVVVPAGSSSLSMYVPRLDINYQLFCDGQLIGGVGAMPPHAQVDNGKASAFALPLMAPDAHAPGLDSSASSRTITLAIRGWAWRIDDPDEVPGLKRGIRIGATQLIRESTLLRTRTVFWNTSSSLFLTLLGSLATVAALVLYFLRPQDKEYLWYGLVSLLSVLKQINFSWTASHAFEWPAYVLRLGLLEEAYALAFMIFLYRLLGTRRDVLFWAAVSAVCADCVLTVGDILPWMISPDWLLADTALFNGLHGVLFLPFALWVLVSIGGEATRGRAEARILLPAASLESLCTFLGFLVVSLGSLLKVPHDLSMRFFATFDWPIPFSVQNIADLLMILSMLAVLVYRFTRTRLHEESYERERAAARTVQQVLIPDSLPELPGFRIATVYKPFGEVGGDFFQIFPIESGANAGSVLIAIGDVSGKGLPAAMTVSLLVGTFRTLAKYTQSPMEVLAAMNERMLGRSNGGFTTCLILRADRNGLLTIANAGHIAPYVGGKELSVENGLPLGLASDASYSESVFQLFGSEQVTLMTDGVAEARSKSGELFGFERTQVVSEQSADTIAHIAQQFGQDDDITVLSLCLA